MSFYINGEEYPVYVDDYLPVRQNKPYIKDRERFWSKLLVADQRNFTIFAASKGSGEV